MESKVNKTNNTNISELCLKNCGTDLFVDLLEVKANPALHDSFLKHIDTCDYCRNIYIASAQSKKLTDKLVKSNSDTIDGFVTERMSDAKAELIKRIRLEADLVDKEPKPSGFKRYATVILPFFQSKRVYALASTAAGILIVTTMFLLSQNLNLINTKFGKTAGDYLFGAAEKSGNIDNAVTEASKQSEQVVDSLSGLPDEIKSDSIDNSETEAYASGEISRDLFIGQDYVWLDGQSEERYIANIAEAVFSAQFSDTDYTYVGIFAYSNNTYDLYVQSIKEIAAESGTGAVIETINGDNTQKLIEYTSESEAAEMLAKASESDASIVIISIGR